MPFMGALIELKNYRVTLSHLSGETGAIKDISLLRGGRGI